jgi:hypothetical protein
MKEAVDALSTVWHFRAGSGFNRRNMITIDHDRLIFAHDGLF